jgi:hypothetical protein
MRTEPAGRSLGGGYELLRHQRGLAEKSRSTLSGPGSILKAKVVSIDIVCSDIYTCIKIPRINMDKRHPNALATAP